MIASLTFTYSTDRTKIYEYKSKDKNDIYFRQKLDYNLYVFHNLTETFVQQIKEKEYLKDLKIKYSIINGPYPDALKNALLFLKKQGVQKIIFLQDDVFSCDKDVRLYDALYNFIKQTKEDYLNLEYLANQEKCTDYYKDSSNLFNVYRVNTEYYINNNMWSFDDSPYYANLDFLINEIYDERYFSYPDIWSAEWYLKAKFEHKKIIKPLTNKQFFRRVNFLGPNNWNHENEIKFLEQNFS